MRLAVPFLFLAIIVSGCASVAPATQEDRETVVIENHSQTKDEAFDRVMRWISTNYNSPQTVIQREDRESGTIILNASTNFRRNIVTFPIRYTMTIDVRDDRIRFTSNVGESEAMGVSKGEVEQVNNHLAVLRMSIMAAVEEDDDF